MSHAAALIDRLVSLLGMTDLSLHPVSGGDVNRAAVVRGRRGQSMAFIKWNEQAPHGLFDAEADGLARLRRPRTVRVPDVWASSEACSDGAPPFLLLEYIEPAPPADPARLGRRLGEALAGLHAAATRGPLFGLPTDNFLGTIGQTNRPETCDWPAFYRDNRLLPQIERARGRGLLPAARERLLQTVVERLDALLDDLPAEASLLHGDLWSGNFLCARGDEPVLIDPAVYFGPREMEIAFTELFGGFPPGFLAAYHAALPLDEGYARRRALHQLYPLLVHLNHFGEAYGSRVDQACRNYVAG